MQLVCVTGDEDNTVSIVDWKAGKVTCSERGDKNRILAVTCNPFDRSGQLNFVTVGVRHIKFWSMQRGRLSAKKGSFGSLAPTSRTMLCASFTGVYVCICVCTYISSHSAHRLTRIAFTYTCMYVLIMLTDGRLTHTHIHACTFADPTHDTGVADVALTGSKDGKVYIWRDTRAVMVVGVFDGPVFDIRAQNDMVSCGGKDSQAPVRMFALQRGWPARMDLVPRAVLHPEAGALANPSRGKRTCVRAVAWRGADMLLGTSRNCIYMADPRSQICRLVVRGHGNGAVTSVSAHDSKRLVCTVGEDGLVRLWDTQQRVAVQARYMRQALNAGKYCLCAWSFCAWGVTVLFFERGV